MFRPSAQFSRPVRGPPRPTCSEPLAGPRADRFRWCRPV